MTGQHVHDHQEGRPRGTPLAAAFGLVAVFMVAEAAAGWLTGSLALISDAGHMATDALGLGMALAALLAARRTTRSGHRTYGLYRTEILAALANALLLMGVAAYVLYEAVGRIGAPPDVSAGPVAVVAVAGLAVNVAVWLLLRRNAAESLNVEGAYVEVVADMAGSVGVLGGAIIIWATGWAVVDSLVAAGIGLFILPRAWSLARRALRILIQAAPPHLDLGDLEARLSGVAGVIDVHDLHVWTLTSEMDVATVHVMTEDGADPHRVLDLARTVLQEAGVAHATLQVEPESHRGCSEVSW